MKDRIFSTAEQIFNDPDLLSRDVTKDGILDTFCNIAVIRFMEKFGYNAFKGLLANEIIDYMESHSDEWSKTKNHVKAHAAINAEHIVIAGLKEKDHGHVVVVLPSEDMSYSGSWGTLVPYCMNVGKHNFFNDRISKAFKEPPIYYMYQIRKLS